jgi:cyanophycinase
MRTKSQTVVCSVVLLSCSWLTSIARAQTTSDRAFFEYSGRPGTVIAAGGGDLPPEIAAAVVQAVGDNGSVVILPDAAEDPVSAAAQAADYLQKAGVKPAAIVGRSTALDDVVRGQVLQALVTAQAVWIPGGQQSRLYEAWQNTTLESSLQALLQRGGMIAGSSAGAAIMSRIMIASGREAPQLATGWDLIPGAIVDQHFSQRNRIARSQQAVSLHPGTTGLGVDEGTAVLLTGRTLRTVGNGNVTILLGATGYRPAETIVLPAGAIADWTQLRRAARQRAAGVDPGLPQFGPSTVSKGALVIVGGGGMPQSIVDRFVQLAGGENANIVVLPTAVPRDQTDLRIPGFLARAGVKKVTVLDQRGPEEVSSDTFRTALKEATGIWFGGGRQWNFVDAYENTDAVAAFHEVLQRGGVIAGSSAGATIQGEFLVRGHPLGNQVMMAEGYERGFAFLPGSAIDQHFAQRGRQPDLLPVIQRHPQMLGVGLDEATAIVVQGSKAEVVGQHSAHFVRADRLQGLTAEQLPKSVDEAAKLYVTIPNGGSIDLLTLQPQ